jgi:hypothetical protein
VPEVSGEPGRQLDESVVDKVELFLLANDTAGPQPGGFLRSELSSEVVSPAKVRESRITFHYVWETIQGGCQVKQRRGVPRRQPGADWRPARNDRRRSAYGINVSF